MWFVCVKPFEVASGFLQNSLCSKPVITACRLFLADSSASHESLIKSSSIVLSIHSIVKCIVFCFVYRLPVVNTAVNIKRSFTVNFILGMQLHLTLIHCSSLPHPLTHARTYTHTHTHMFHTVPNITLRWWRRYRTKEMSMSPRRMTGWEESYVSIAADTISRENFNTIA